MDRVMLLYAKEYVDNALNKIKDDEKSDCSICPHYTKEFDSCEFDTCPYIEAFGYIANTLWTDVIGDYKGKL